MKDVTKQLLQETEYKPQRRLNERSRQEFLLDRLSSLARSLDPKKIVMVWVVAGNGNLVQVEFGDVQTARDLVRQYDATHTMRLSVRRDWNSVIIRLGERLKEVHS